MIPRFFATRRRRRRSSRSTLTSRRFSYSFSGPGFISNAVYTGTCTDRLIPVGWLFATHFAPLQRKKNTMKFTPEKSHFPTNFSGFWKPKEGDVVRGVIRDAFDGEFGKTLIVEVCKNEYGPAIEVAVETRDRDTNEKITKTAKAGAAIGVNEKANLRGLDKFVGHAVNIRCLGKVAGDNGMSTYEFDTDLGAKLPTKEEKKPQAASKSA